MPRCQSVLLLALVALSAAPAAAAAPPAAVAPQSDPLQASFEALPEADRRALQAALIWTADFAGAVTGGYGPRTRDALLADARRIGAAPAAALDAATRARLLSDADAARRAVGFSLVRDPRTGVAIGVPLKLATQRSTLPDGTRYASPDGSFSIELSARPDAGPAALDDAADRLTRAEPGRRVTYRLLRPDFAVVTGEQGDKAFYTRVAFSPGPGAALRGFTVSRPRADARGGVIALAVAASFDPFPPVDTLRPPPTVVAPPAAAPLAGEAVLVGPGLALTRVARAGCPSAEIGGAPARWLRQDPGSDLALMSVSGHADAAPVALGVAGPPGGLALFFTSGEGEPALSAAAATPLPDGGIRAPLQRADAGVVLIDGTGALAGVTGRRQGGGAAVAGTVAAARYDVASAAAVAAFLAEGSVATARPEARLMSAGEAVVRWRPALLPLRCRAG